MCTPYICTCSHASSHNQYVFLHVLLLVKSLRLLISICSSSLLRLTWFKIIGKESALTGFPRSAFESVSIKDNILASLLPPPPCPDYSGLRLIDLQSLRSIRGRACRSWYRIKEMAFDILSFNFFLGCTTNYISAVRKKTSWQGLSSVSMV